MISLDKLIKTTDEFFNKFCNSRIEIPKWSNKWIFEGELPFNSYKGCYAHLNDKDEIIYIGVGIGNSLAGSGIGSRISKYWKKNEEYNINNQLYSPTIADTTAIITLPFNNDYYYLASALEIYLIDKLNPPKNRVHRRF